MNNILLFILGKFKGFTPCCDRCLDVNIFTNTISFIQYIRQRKGELVYCNLCWNWIHLMKGKCECGTIISHRDKWGVKIKMCPTCYKLIKLYK